MSDFLSPTPIVIAFTPNYFIPAATCLQSILQASPVAEQYHVICLLTEELPLQMKEHLYLLGKERLAYTFLNLKDELKGVYVDERYTVAASYRLLLPNLLPDYDKVLYTDCDIIVRNNLGELYRDTDLGDCLLGAVYEAPLANQVINIKKIGCNPDTYLNSGFLLMNLKQMRLENISTALIDTLRTDYLEFPDQDALNIVCIGRVFPLPPYWNSIRTFFLPRYEYLFLRKYTKADLLAVKKHGNIHYTGGKPWNEHTVAFAHWWNCYEQLPARIRVAYPVNARVKRIYNLYKLPFAGIFVNVLRSLSGKLK